MLFLQGVKAHLFSHTTSSYFRKCTRYPLKIVIILFCRPSFQLRFDFLCRNTAQTRLSRVKSYLLLPRNLPEPEAGYRCYGYGSGGDLDGLGAPAPGTPGSCSLRGLKGLETLLSPGQLSREPPPGGREVNNTATFFLFCNHE